MDKDRRQKKIAEIIRKKQISKQEELISLLEKEKVFLNQSAVSRDLGALGVIKINGFYALPEAQINENFGLLSMEAVGENMVIAKCEAGMASAVCVKIDRKEIAEIVGTLAGEDTIFIAVRNQKEQKIALKKIWEIFQS